MWRTTPGRPKWGHRRGREGGGVDEGCGDGGAREGGSRQRVQRQRGAVLSLTRSFLLVLLSLVLFLAWCLFWGTLWLRGPPLTCAPWFLGGG